MTDYTKNASFTAKTGQTIEGSDFDSEFDEIATAIASKENTANKGANSGYCGLDSSGLVAAADLPAATATAQGAVELATDAEAVAGTDTARAVTPAGLAAALAGATTDTTAYKAADQSSTTTAYAADSDLSIALTTGLWEIYGTLILYSTTVSIDMEIGPSFSGTYTSGESGILFTKEPISSSAYSSESTDVNSGATINSWATCDIPGSTAVVSFHGLVRATGSGDFKLYWAQNVGSGTAVTMKKGSVMHARQIA